MYIHLSLTSVNETLYMCADVKRHKCLCVSLFGEICFGYLAHGGPHSQPWLAASAAWAKLIRDDAMVRSDQLSFFSESFVSLTLP